MELQEWRIASATVAGTSHHKSSTPCQDSHLCDLVRASGDVLVVIASDGAGSASRSDAGSNMACMELLENIHSFLESGGRVSDLTREVVVGWIENVAARINHAAQTEGLTPREFACTLLAGLVTDAHAAFLQIGDGAMVIRPRGDDWCYVFWPQHGEYVNTTIFVTDPASVEKLEFEVHSHPVDEIAAFTDGIESLVLHYATQAVHTPFFDGVFPAVRALSESGASVPLSASLADYLDSSSVCERTDDDKTLILASRLKHPPSRSLVVLAEA